MMTQETMRPLKDLMPVLAHDVASSIDVPPFDRAAMDGYGTVASDLAGASREKPRSLRLEAAIHAGDAAAPVISPGSCVQIATGAPIPSGADTVVPVEETRREGESVLFFKEIQTGSHIIRKGEDIKKSSAVFPSETWLSPARVGALAALGFEKVEVFARVRTAIAPTGPEVIRPGRPLGPGQVYDINTFSLRSLLHAHGAAPSTFDIADDSLESLERILEEAESHDLMVFSGGSSVGEKDLLVDVIERMGKVFFHGIAIKPGKPTLFGEVRGTPVVGMPGYPTSCLMNAYTLLIPLVRRMAHLPTFHPPRIQAPLGATVRSHQGKRHFLTVKVTGGKAVPAFKSSGAITSMAWADGFIEIPEDTTVLPENTPVTVILF
ncbi:MAG: molybdopterin molybdotransferase MoeA [Armatimonadetes bacterium]|nr:molybdopterin molybdotransferase MoeA [Armatimonadota bacterium]